MFPSNYGSRPSSYHNPAAFYGYPPLRRPAYPDVETLAREREHAEVFAARRARRAQYLPSEDAIDSDEEDFYGLLNQREKIYLDAKKRREALENERRREAAAAAEAINNAQKAAAERDMTEKMQRYRYSRAMNQHDEVSFSCGCNNVQVN